MKCKLTLDAIYGYLAFFVFIFLVTLGPSFLSYWKVWYISCTTSLGLLGTVYCVLLVLDERPTLVMDMTGIAFKNKFLLFGKLKFISWTSVKSYYEYTYPLDHEMQPTYMVLICTNGKKQKINISGLDFGKDEIMGVMRKYYSSARDDHKENVPD